MDTRLAIPDDADEVLRLAHVMWREFDIEYDGGEWENEFRSFFRRRVGSDNYRVYVIDNPDEAGLISCGIGLIHELTPAFWLPNGRIGYLQWFSTDPEWRNRGLGSTILDKFIAWFREERLTRVHLHAHKPAIPMYRRAGFEDTSYPNLWLRLSYDD